MVGVAVRQSRILLQRGVRTGGQITQDLSRRVLPDKLREFGVAYDERDDGRGKFGVPRATNSPREMT